MKKLVIILTLMLVCIPTIFSDVIIMKAGKKYIGTVVEYYDGRYIIKIKGKKYQIPGDSVKDIQYTDSAEQVRDAIKNEDIHMNIEGWDTKQYIGAAYRYVMPLFSNYTGTIAGGLSLFSVAFGLTCEKTSYGTRISYGSMSGTLKYNDPYTGSQSTFINSGAVILGAEYVGRLPLRGIPITPFAEIDLGPTINFDSIGSYPLGYKDTYIPGSITAKKVTAVYLGGTVGVNLGVDIKISDPASVQIFAGYMLLTKNRYTDPRVYGKTIDFLIADDKDVSANAGGLYLSAEARMKF
jgi:hypothetical protein